MRLVWKLALVEHVCVQAQSTRQGFTSQDGNAGVVITICADQIRNLDTRSGHPMLSSNFAKDPCEHRMCSYSTIQYGKILVIDKIGGHNLI